MSAASTGILRTELDTAVASSRDAREAAERELHRSRALRARAAEALEHTARRPGCDETERARLRAEYAAADRVVAERQAALAHARELEHAVGVVAEAYVEAPSPMHPVAAALLEFVAPAPAAPAARASRARAARGSARRAEPAARLRGTRPRSA